MHRLVVFASGTGSNAEAIILACINGILQGKAEVVLVISDKPDAKVIDKAKALNVPTLILGREEFPSYDAWMAALADTCQEERIDLICLAGFMRKIEGRLLEDFSGRIINLHPSRLPKFPGTGAVQKALEAGELETGCTLHFVTAGDPRGADGTVIYDSGPIIHIETVPIVPGDTVDSLMARIHEQEHIWYPRVILWYVNGELQITPERTVVRMPKW